jgi:hypothetical protein
MFDKVLVKLKAFYPIWGLHDKSQENTRLLIREAVLHYAYQTTSKAYD